MSAAQFLLWMSIARISLMIATILWLTFRVSRDPKMRFVCATSCMVMLGSNLINVGVSIGILKVTPW